MNSGQSFSFSSVLILETTNSVVSRFSLFFSLQVRRLLIGCQEYSGSPTSQWDRRRNRTSQKDLRAAEGQSEMLRLFPLCIWVPAFNNQSDEVSDEKKGQSVCQWFGQSNWRGSFKQETGHIWSQPRLKNVTTDALLLWRSVEALSCRRLNVKSWMFQGAAADRFLSTLSGFINGLDTKNNVKVRDSRRPLNFHYK